MGKTRQAIVAAALALTLLPGAALAAAKDTVVLGMTLEPPGLDPTSGAAAAIGEVTHYNIYEGLAKIEENGKVTPLLAKSWTVSPDQKTYTFKLRPGVSFQNGEKFTSADVKYTFERDASPTSTNKDKKSVFANFAAIDTPDPLTVVLHLKELDANLIFELGQNTAVILEPKSAATDATKPVGTGPYKFENWVKGSSITLVKWAGFRDARKVEITKATFRIINDPAAQVAALLAGDVDAFPRFGALDSLKQLQSDPRFTVAIGSTEGKTIVAINNKRKPFDDVRVRRALAYAIDRKAVIAGASNGLGVPIGSHYTPNDPGYIDLTGLYPYDPAKAKALLKEAGVKTPLSVTLKLPPPPYARQGGQIVAAELAQIGINARIENVEWAQWLDGVYKNKNFDLTMISHVEPRDLAIYANPDYYFQYDSPKFRQIMAKVNATPDGPERLKLLGEAQRQIAEDAVNVFLYVLPQVAVSKKDLHGVWHNSPIFANDLAALHWK
ncbi:MAG TPA: ABC transporter substrate-binding protein [Stellaceae bacterium]|nr:ABC transporter substrate-binding protein [Stellaceae bacterium]